VANKYKQETNPSENRKAPEVMSNYYIRAKRIKVIDETGKYLGEFPFRVALERAQNLDLDLIQVGGGEVPTCKMGDLNKFLYERKKKEKERNRQIRENTFETKQVIIHITIDKNDLARKISEVSKFIEAGHNVKFSLQMRGREIAMKDDAFKLVRECTEKLAGIAEVDVPAKLNGRSIDMTFRKIRG